MNILCNISYIIYIYIYIYYIYHIYIYYTLYTLYTLLGYNPQTPRHPIPAQGLGVCRQTPCSVQHNPGSGLAPPKAQCLGLEKALRNEAHINFIRGNRGLKG